MSAVTDLDRPTSMPVCLRVIFQAKVKRKSSERGAKKGH